MSTTHDTTSFDPTISLGADLSIPRLGYGAMQLTGPGVIGLPRDLNGAVSLLRHAVDVGVRFFDTANAYGPRTVNQLIGRALSPLGNDIVIGNKVGATRGPRGEWLTDGRPQTIRNQVEDALLDMRTERSDLTYLRLPGDSADRAGAIESDVPMEESLGVLVEMQQEGKIARIGLSGASSTMLARASRMTTIVAVQNRFNLIDRSGVEVLEACERAGIAFVPYFPLAAGGLNNAESVSGPAQRLGMPEPVVALAWLLRRSPVIVPIPGTTSVQHLEDNLRAATVAPLLTDGEIQALTAMEDEGSATLATMPTRMRTALHMRNTPRT